MDLSTTIKELSARMGQPKPRAAFGQWVPYAWVVRGLVEKGHGISDAVHQVLNSSGFSESKSAFGSLRASYYKIRDAEWPAELATKDEEGFE